MATCAGVRATKSGQDISRHTQTRMFIPKKQVIVKNASTGSKSN